VSRVWSSVLLGRKANRADYIFVAVDTWMGAEKFLYEGKGGLFRGVSSRSFVLLFLVSLEKLTSFRISSLIFIRSSS